MASSASSSDSEESRPRRQSTPPPAGDLEHAIEEGRLDAALAILDAHENGSKPVERLGRRLDEALPDAVRRRDLAAVDLLLGRGARITHDAFVECARAANPAIFEAFLDHGFDINSTEFGEPMLRLCTGKKEMLDIFFARGADLGVSNARGITALATAVSKNDPSTVKLLVEHGAPLEPDILHHSLTPTSRTDIAMLRLLVELGADVRHAVRPRGDRPWERDTPLHMAALHRTEETVRLLLEAGADPDLDVEGTTPLDNARRRLWEAEQEDEDSWAVGDREQEKAKVELMLRYSTRKQSGERQGEDVM